MKVHGIPVLVLLAQLTVCSSEAMTKNRRKVEVKSVELIPGTAIGPIRMGTREEDLPKEAKVTHGVGSLDDVHFSVAGGKVDDVWVDNLASFPHDLRWKGKSIARPTTLEGLTALFGECVLVEGVLGGIFYNCKAGVTIGCDQERRPAQIRLKPR